ncbi:MAG TPA: enoyl-CoA hydratase family protein [Kineosporiaceae bacterium]|nr:enoyl-CoA hydratase family protein [Kineosporiaceae bacterium]
MALVTQVVEAAVSTLTLDSPANRNALSRQLLEELSEGLDAAAADDGVRAVVLSHTGRTFCAGADLRESAATGDTERGTARFVALLRQIVDLPKPVLARVNGHVRAGGLGLLGACDLVVAGPQSSFAFTEVRLGLAPAIIALVTQSRMPERLAARYLLTGETFDATTAERAGLVTVAAADVDVALAVLLDALRLASPQGLAATKPLTTARVRAALEADGEAAQRLSAQLFGTAEAREGIAAWAQKRPPSWFVASP